MKNDEVRPVMLERMEFYELINLLENELTRIYDNDIDGDNYPSPETERKERLLKKLQNILGE